MTGPKLFIAMTAYRRPGCLVRVLESLAANDFWGWSILVRCEPGDKTVLGVLTAALGFGAAIVKNKRVEGPHRNPLLAIDDCFERGADVVWYNQDDFLLSPDALDLGRWFAELPERDKYLALTTTCYRSDPTRPLDVVEYRGDGVPPRFRGQAAPFPGYPFAFSRHGWETWGRKAWWASDYPVAGPDWGLSGYLDGTCPTQLACLAPAYSRAFHIGREGTFISTQLQERLYDRIPWNQERHEGGFRLVTAGEDMRCG